MAFLAMVGMIALMGCGERPSEPAEPANDEQEKPEARAEGERVYWANGMNLPMLSSILPAYEKLSGMKIIVAESITDADTLTLESPLKMTRDEAIAFYKRNFEEQGFEIHPVNETTLVIKRKAGAAEPQKPLRPRRVVLSPRASEPTAARDDEPEQFMAMAIQTPLIDVILPVYQELVNKTIIVDTALDAGSTMTINSGKKMSRAEAIQFYEDSFKLNGYTLTEVDEWTVRFSKSGPVE